MDENSATKQANQIPKQTDQTRFADYFVICGLELDTGLEPAGMSFIILKDLLYVLCIN